MTKTHFKYLITVSILLLILSGQLGLYSGVLNQPVKNSTSSKNIRAFVQHENSTLISPFFIFKNHDNLFFDEKLEDDTKENVTSQKSNVENSCSLSTFFNSYYTKPSLLENTQDLHFGKHFLHISHNKLFITFSLFRI